MTALWMVYVLVLGTLLAAAAACADAALRAAGRSSRLVWAAAIAATVALPAGALVLASRPVPPSAPASTPTAGAPSQALAALLARAELRQETTPARSWAHLDRPLLAAWAAAALLGLGWVVLSRRRLGAMARRWRPATVGGEAVLVAPDAGPAAVGARGGQIVLPAWALSIDARELALMLAHERSHLAARDPQLLAAAAVAVALAPWNPALWWQLRRLRLAVEIDCDRRVLRRHPDVAAYGALLLDVARRGTAGRPRFAAALSAPTPVTTLERRIRTMTSRRPRHVAVRALAYGGVGLGLAIAACETPHPTGLRPESRVPLASITNAAPSAASAEGGPSLERVRAAIAAAMPQVASGSVRAKRIWLVSDAAGTVVNAAFDAGGGPGQVGLRGATVRLRADDREVLVAKDANVAEPDGGPAWAKELDPATIRSVDVLKLAPGRVTPDSVGVIWITLRAPGEARGADAPSGVAGLSGSVKSGEGRYRLSVNDRGEPTSIQVTGDGSLSRAASAAPAARAGAAGGMVRVRSAVGGPTPLYVIDGKDVPRGPEGEAIVSALSPDDIASVGVWKGEGALKEFGAKGAHGVVKITTKKAAAAAQTREY